MTQSSDYGAEPSGRQSVFTARPEENKGTEPVSFFFFSPPCAFKETVRVPFRPQLEILTSDLQVAGTGFGIGV
jgi:hypothetical protein